LLVGIDGHGRPSGILFSHNEEKYD
jgi:hypothetical protein